MGDVSKAINNYISNEIRLNMSDISQSSKSREWFITRIENEIKKNGNNPQLYAPEPFIYFGSYFKGTKVKAVDEYDVLLVIDSNNGTYSSNGVEIGKGQGSASPNHKYDQAFHKSDGNGVSPAKLLNWLQRIAKNVTDSFGGETPIRAGQAVTAEIKSSNIKIDLVPAGIFKKSNGEIFYNIPRGDVNNGWIATSPRTDISLLNGAANKRNNLKNVVRILKRIKDTYNFLVPSFAIETSVIEYVHYNAWYQDLYTDVRGSLEYLAELFKIGKIPDPLDPTNNLISGIDSLSWYADRIATIIKGLDYCKLIIDDDIDNRVYKIFENKL